MPSRTRASLCLLSLAVALTTVPGAPAAAAPPQTPAGPRTLTLITGDRFAVTADGAGVVKLPSPGRDGVHYLTRRQAGRLEVVPDDAVALLGAGRLDPRLFDITTLVESGYDDNGGDLPLIVDYAGGDPGERAVRSRITAVDAEVVKDLSAVDALAVEQRRDRAAELWTTLTAPAGAGTRSLRPEVAKVWLDGKRELHLDESVALVGAPAAWAAGFTGEGVPVGVIDSGVDGTHPDLAGRVEARDFTGTGLTDSTGHGTHVASTIAGSGQHSGGRYRGVAPGARIYSGKACPNRSCAESAMIEAMRWMAADLRLRVVNISIGGPDEPGADQLENAVDTLSRDFGTLFVISAGNSGAIAPVSSPASADTALAVAATNKDDTPADYSSQGPRADAGVLKPDLAAPGTDITAAAAAGVFNSDGYASMTGTSMAAPHVAGAAAILAQRHPEWTAEQLKAALTASAHALATETSPYQQGAGRLDVARAISQTVTTSPPSVQVDDLTPEGAVTTRTVTYRNTSAAAVTLRLALTGRTTLGKPAPAGMFQVGARRVTVPAGGEATVDVTVDARTAPRPAAFGGVLTATGEGVSVRTPIVLDRQPTVKLSLTHLDRGGVATSQSRVVIAGLDSRFTYATTEVRGGKVELELPAGRYLVSSTIMTPAGTSRTVTMLTDPELDLRADTALSMDARLGKPMAITTDHPGAVQNSGFVNISAETGAGELLALGIGGPFDGVFTARLGDGDDGHAETRISAGFAEPGDDGRGRNSPWTLTATHIEPGVADGWSGMVSTLDAATVRQDLGSAVDGSTATIFNVPHWAGVPDDFAAALEHALPGVRTDQFVSARGVSWETQFWHNVLGMSEFPPGAATYANSVTAAPVRYRAGRTYRQSWNRAVFGPAFPRPDLALVRDGDRIIGTPTLFSDAEGRYGSAIAVGTFVRLDRGTETVTTQPYLALNAAVPPEEATYRLLVNSGRRPVVGLATQNTVAWTFTSKQTSAAEPLPLSVLRFKPVVDSRNTVIGDRVYRLAFDTQAQPGSAAPPITDLRLEVSHDGGVTWVRPPVTQAGGAGVARVERPAGSGTVSIRSTATDREGGTVEQTIMNAFRY